MFLRACGVLPHRWYLRGAHDMRRSKERRGQQVDGASVCYGAHRKPHLPPYQPGSPPQRRRRDCANRRLPRNAALAHMAVMLAVVAWTTTPLACAWSSRTTRKSRRMEPSIRSFTCSSVDRTRWSGARQRRGTPWCIALEQPLALDPAAAMIAQLDGRGSLKFAS